MKFFAFLSLLILSVFAQAQTNIYDTFDQYNGWNTGEGWTVSTIQSVATLFTVSSSADLYSIGLGLGGGVDYTVSLTTDTGSAPGTTLETWQVTGTGYKVTVSPVSNLFLAAGNYCVVASSSNPAGVWGWNDLGHSGNSYFTTAGNWYVNGPLATGAMEIQVQSVPEPSALLVMGLGLLGLALSPKRNG